MLNLKGSRTFLALTGCAFAALLFAGSANAATENVIAEIEFVAPVSIAENNQMRFGLLDVAFAAADDVVLATDSTFTDLAGRVVGGSQTAASLTITATESQGISIVVENVVDNTGYALVFFTCDYDGAGSTPCPETTPINVTTPAASTTSSLLIGATLDGDGTAAVGQQFGAFDVTVNYQ